MATLAQTLKKSVRTIQRHVHLLASRGWIVLVERRRHQGRFSSYLYRVLYIAKTTGHGSRVARSGLYKRQRTKGFQNSQQAYITSTDQEQSAEVRKQRQRERRKAGYEWLFGE